MTVYTYDTILKKAKECKNNVQTHQKGEISHKWAYYIGCALLNPKKDVTKISIAKAPKPSHTHISRQMTKSQYLALAKKLVDFVKKEHRLPNYLYWKGYKLSGALYTYTFSRCLVYRDKYGKYDNEINVNSKVFKAPTETGNAVYDYFVKKTGKKPKTLDDILEYVCNYFQYQGYYDDKKSNKQVTDSKSGNCVDLLQWLMNMTEPLGYDSKCIHVQCRTSGTGHVFGKFRHKKNTDGKWVTRDPAAVCQNSIHNVWCENGYLLAENPSWFLENLNR